MSAPLIPNKSCYSQLQDNRSEIRNNNESIVNVGDTNANQIVTKVRTTDGDVKKQDLTDESGNIYCVGTDKVTHLPTEQNKLLTFKESRTCHNSVQESKLPSTTSREMGKDCRTSEAKDMSRHIRISRGQSLSNLKSSTNDTNLEVISKGDVDVTQNFPKGKMSRTVEVERIKRLSLGRPSKFSPQPETFAKDGVGHMPCKHLLSASLDSINSSHHLVGSTEKSQKTSTDHFLGMVFRPLDNTSEENTVFYSKPSTSGNKKTSKPENVPNVSVESTLHTSYSQHSFVKLDEVANKSEAQLGQGDKSKKLELRTAPSLQYKNTCPQKTERIMLVEFLGCPKAENTAVQEQKSSGSDMSKFQVSHFQDTCNKVEDPLSSQVVTPPDDKLQSDNITISGEGRGGNDSDSRATSQAGEEYFTDEEMETIFPLASGSKSSIKLTPRKNKKLHQVDTGCAETVGAQISPTRDINPPDSKPLKVNENKLMLVKESTEDAVVTASGPSDHHRARSAETVSNQQPDSHSSDVETSSVSVSSKETANVQEHPPEESPESCNIPTKADVFLCVPTPVLPVATPGINDQPMLSDSNLKELYALHDDKLSPSSVLPPIDSTQLLNISPKVPIMTACSSAIPKPILVHPKGSLTDKAGVDSDCSEKLEETVEMKPAIPQPKPVRPKIITYIRRNPRSIEQLDPLFTPAGLPFDGPACSVPIPAEQKASHGGEAKPASILYDKFKPDLQKPRLFGSGLVVSGIRPPGHHFGPMSEKFLQEVGERPAKDEFCPAPYTHYEVPPGFYRSAMILKPQLGLGAVSRLPSAKSRILIASQRSPGSCLHQQGEITSAPSLYHPDASVDLKKGSCPSAAKSNLPKLCPSGLRPPGYSRLPAAKLAAFGFVRSSSVSSVSSNQSNDSAQSDQRRTTNCKS
ncbi:MTUS2 protein, partial [Picathartes gymnocephalus]|nr:MTUS2 protein [Picathartes gymnocephalus]